jgi:hypothetical protein
MGLQGWWQWWPGEHGSRSDKTAVQGSGARAAIIFLYRSGCSTSASPVRHQCSNFADVRDSRAELNSRSKFRGPAPMHGG